MNASTRLGRLLLAAGIAGFGVLSFVFSDPVLGLEPLPQWLLERVLWTYLSGAVLIAAGAALAADKTARIAAILAAAVLLLWVLLLHVPLVVLHPNDGARGACSKRAGSMLPA